MRSCGAAAAIRASHHCGRLTLRCAMYMCATWSGPVACSTALSSRTPMKRGKRTATPRSLSGTRPRAAACTGDRLRSAPRTCRGISNTALQTQCLRSQSAPAAFPGIWFQGYVICSLLFIEMHIESHVGMAHCVGHLPGTEGGCGSLHPSVWHCPHGYARLHSRPLPVCIPDLCPFAFQTFARLHSRPLPACIPDHCSFVFQTFARLHSRSLPVCIPDFCLFAFQTCVASSHASQCT